MIIKSIVIFIFFIAILIFGSTQIEKYSAQYKEKKMTQISPQLQNFIFIEEELNEQSHTLQKIYHFFSDHIWGRIFNKNFLDSKFSFAYFCQQINLTNHSSYAINIYDKNQKKNMGFVFFIPAPYLFADTNLGYRDYMVFYSVESNISSEVENLCVDYAIQYAKEKGLNLWIMPFLWTHDINESFLPHMTTNIKIPHAYLMQTYYKNNKLDAKEVKKIMLLLNVDVTARICTIPQASYQKLQEWFQLKESGLKKEFDFFVATKSELALYAKDMSELKSSLSHDDYGDAIYSKPYIDQLDEMNKSFYYPDGPQDHYCVVKDKQKNIIVGMLKLSLADHLTTSYIAKEYQNQPVFMSNLCILPEYRGKSLGKILVYLANKEVQKYKKNDSDYVDMLFLNATVSPSLGFYKNIGFKILKHDLEVGVGCYKHEIILRLV